MRSITIVDGTEIGASHSYLTFADGSGIGVDYGLSFDKEFVRAPDASDRKYPNRRMVVTHAHLDHMGGVPLLGPEWELIGTPATRAIAYPMLQDSANVNRRRRSGGLNISWRDTEAVLDHQYQELSFGTSLQLSGGVTMTLYRAGHVLGAAMPFFNDNGFRVLHTGNFCLSNQRLLAGAEFLHAGIDVLVLDSTYGAQEHEPRMRARQQMANFIYETTQRGGRIMVPAFALGRFQEVLAVIRDLRKVELIPNVPIYADGSLAHRICEIYLAHFEDLRWRNITDNPLAVHMVRQRITDQLYPDVTFIETEGERTDLLASKEPMVVVTSSGMLEGGIAKTWLLEIAKSSLNGIAFTGYLAEESTGELVLNAETGSTVRLRTPEGGTDLEVHCRRAYFNFSAHSGARELVEVVKRTRPKKIILIHGSAYAKNKLAQSLRKAGGWEVYIPERGEEIELD